MRGFVTGLRTGFPDLQFTVERLCAEGDKAAARWFIQGTHNGPFLGMPPTGNKVKDQGLDVFVFSGGKIAEIWVNENDLGLMKQLGAFG
jgi:predicted ester cyclase